MIRIGTSGFDYKDGYGTFFPPALKPQHRLGFYIYFNNHYRGKAAKNARTLSNLLAPS